MKVRFGFVCDDARGEDNGKLLFIGAYGPQILVPEMPAILALCLVIAMEVDEPGERKSQFQVLMGEEKIVGGLGKLRASSPGSHFFPIGALPLEVKKEGDLVFQVKLDDQDWQTVCAQPIAIRAST